MTDKDLAFYQAEAQERWARDDVAFRLTEIGRLCDAIHQLHRVRNAFQGFTPEVIRQRQAIMDVAIRVVEGDLKKEIANLPPLISKWLRTQ